MAKQDIVSIKIKNKINVALCNVLNEDKRHPDIVITVGGDGTILRAVQQYINELETTHFVGIHTGTLGFYTDYEIDEVDALINDIIQNKYTIATNYMIEVEYKKDGKNYLYYGLNEARVENNYSTLVCDIHIDDEFLETFRGNGLCISSSSGSTAYNRSIGGSVVSPGIPVIQMGEIAGIHHNAYRSLQSSLILGKEHSIHCDLLATHNPILGVDQLIFEIEGVERVTFRLANKVVKFINYRSASFINRIRRAFING